MTEDSILLEQYAQSGDADALSELISRYAGMVYATCLRVTRNEQDAEDAAQECFMDLVRKSGSITSSLPGWLHKTAIDRARIAIRVNIRRRHREELAMLENYREEELTWEIASPFVDQALEKLPEEEKVPLILMYLNRKSQKDIAEDLGVDQSTVSRRISQGLEKLRNGLRDLGLVAPCTALAALLTENAVVASPPTLLVSLGKLAMAGFGGAASQVAEGSTVKTVMSGVSFMKIAVAGFVVITAAAVGTIVIKQKSGSVNPAIMPAVTTGSQLGSADFIPSPDRPVGWRGDGTGKYPGANPPTEWGRWPTGGWKDFLHTAKKPSDPAGKEGRPVSRGIIRDWLVIGPFEPKDPAKALDEEYIANEGAVQPDADQKAGNLAWQSCEARARDWADQTVASAAGLTFRWIFPGAQSKNMAAYGHAYLYSPARLKCALHCGSTGPVKAWLNGKEIFSEQNLQKHPKKLAVLDLDKGWNRLLVKTAVTGLDTTKKNAHWGFSVLLLPEPPFTYETKNIAWITPMPGISVSSPIIVGDKVFVSSQPGDLICANKTDGKILWIRPINMYLAASAEDKANPAIKDVAGDLLNQQKQANQDTIKAFNDKVSSNGPSYEEDQAIKVMLKKKRGIDKQVFELMEKVDMKKYGGRRCCEGGWDAPTPCSDGKNVYVYNTDGLAACVSLDGELRWINCSEEEPYGGEHGQANSPLIMNDKLVVSFRKDRVAFDTATGKVAWRQKAEVIHGAFASMLKATCDGKPVIATPLGEIVDPSDGSLLAPRVKMLGIPFPTPVIEKGMLYHVSNNGQPLGHFLGLKVVSGNEKKILDVDINLLTPSYTAQPSYTFSEFVSSPLIHDGLAYIVDGRGYFWVLDIANKKVASERYLDINAAPEGYRFITSASITLAGRKIYIMDNKNTCAVIEPGPEGKQIAKNTIQNTSFEWFGPDQELTLSTPVFNGNRMYYRGTRYLYCIEEK